MKCKLVNENFKSDYLTNLLRARGVEDIEGYLNPNQGFLQDPTDLDNIEDGAQLLLDTIVDRGKIWMVADCDCDGATSFAIIYNYLKENFPSVQIDWDIHEHKEHGLSDCIEKLENSETKYDLAILVDSSSNDYEYHERLAALGTKVLVLDHHEVDMPISENCILINNQTSAKYRNKDLSGAGIAWQFCRVLDKALQFETDFSSSAWDYIDLAAVGCCGDMMKITSMENRFIFAYGFSHIKNTFLKALVEKQDYSMGGKINYTSVAFYIVPLLNAMIRSGTMEEKRRMYEAFINGNKFVPSGKRGAKGTMERLAVESARECANARTRQNKTIENAMGQLEIKIHKHDLLSNKILFVRLDEENFPSEINGLIAMRLSQKYRRPTLIGRLNDEGFVRGSARGLSNCEITSLKDFLEELGFFEYTAGHAQAFGYSIANSKLDEFHKYANEKLKDMDFDEDVMEVNFERAAADPDIPELIRCLGSCPEVWGQDCPEPKIWVRDINITMDDVQIMGKTLDTVKIVKFGVAYMKFHAKDLIEDLQKYPEVKMEIVGRANLNIWNNITTPQIFIDQYQIEDGQYGF